MSHYEPGTMWRSGPGRARLPTRASRWRVVDRVGDARLAAGTGGLPAWRASRHVDQLGCFNYRGLPLPSPTASTVNRPLAELPARLILRGLPRRLHRMLLRRLPHPYKSRTQMQVVAMCGGGCKAVTVVPTGSWLRRGVPTGKGPTYGTGGFKFWYRQPTFKEVGYTCASWG